MSKNYFENITNIEDLKTAYKKLALQFHPDRPNGNTETMKLINIEYDTLFTALRNIHKKVDSEGNTTEYTATTNTTETSEDFKNIINELINCNDIEISIVGSWLWVAGEGTKIIKAKLKELGFFWNSKRILWQLKPASDRKYKFKNSKEDNTQIKSRYGETKIISNRTFSLA